MIVDNYLGKYPFTDNAKQSVETEFEMDDVFRNDVLTRAISRVKQGVDNKNTMPTNETISAEVDLLSYPVARILVSLLEDTRIISRYARAEARTSIKYLQTQDATPFDELLDIESKQNLTISELCNEYELEFTEISQKEFIVDLGDEYFNKLTESEKKEFVKMYLPNSSPEIIDSVESRSVSSLAKIADEVISAHSVVEMYKIPVTEYVQSSSKISEQSKSLANMPVQSGDVYITQNELLSVLEELIYADVLENLPVSVPEEIADSVEVQDAVDVIRHTTDDKYFTFEINEVNESKFPPCIESLLESTRKGEHLEHNARFALASFLVNIGMNTEEILELFGGVPDFAEDQTRYQINHIRGEVGNTEYTSPACATMVTQGLCVNKDELCEHINHPLTYYRIRLDDYGDGNQMADDTEEE